MTKIFIDAGHGGKDGGAGGFGLNEKNVVLELAKRLEKRLKEYKNVQVMLSRTGDTFLELAERTQKANSWGADCLVSLHINASTSSSAKGFESFIYNGSVGSDTIAFQNVMHEEIMKEIGGVSGIVDRGKKRANFHMLRESEMKAILTESLFISNQSDASRLKESSFLDKLVEGHLKGLEKFFGLERVIRPPTEEKPVTDEPSGLYQVIAGTFSTRERAEAHAKKLEQDGYDCYVKQKE